MTELESAEELPAQPNAPAVNRRRLIIALSAIAVVLVGGAAWYLARDDDQARALGYARQACEHYNPNPTDTSAPGSSQAVGQADAWQASADNAARAARLDPAWNELARAMDAEYRVWNLYAMNDPSRGDEAATVLQEIKAHPVDPECRKARVG